LTASDLSLTRMQRKKKQQQRQLEWSDDEDDDVEGDGAEKKLSRYKALHGPQPPRIVKPSDLEIETRLLQVNIGELCDDDKKATIDYTRRSQIFSGDAKKKAPAANVVTSKKSLEQTTPLKGRTVDPNAFKHERPFVRHRTEQVLGNEMLDYIWQRFLDMGADESELLEARCIPKIAARIQQNTGLALPFDQIKMLKKMDGDDYIEFSFVMNELAILTSDTLSSHILGTFVPPGPDKSTINNLVIQLNKYAEDKKGGKEGEEEENEDGEEEGDGEGGGNDLDYHFEEGGDTATTITTFYLLLLSSVLIVGV
jgi:hypothetical protein